METSGILPTLLVVTHASTKRSFFQKHFSDLYYVLHAQSTTEAADKIKYEKIDLFVLDEKNELLDLEALCKHIRSFSDYKQTPILVITGSLKRSFTRKLLNAGANDFLADPLIEEEILEKIHSSLQQMATKSKLTLLHQVLPKQKKIKASLKDRVLFSHQAQKLFQEAKEKRFSFSLIGIRLKTYDSLKANNASALDEAIFFIQKALTKQCRSQDIMTPSNHGRQLLILPKTTKKAATMIAEEIKEEIQAKDLPIALAITSLDKELIQHKNIDEVLEQLYQELEA